MLKTLSTSPNPGLGCIKKPAVIRSCHALERNLPTSVPTGAWGERNRSWKLKPSNGKSKAGLVSSHRTVGRGRQPLQTDPHPSFARRFAAGKPPAAPTFRRGEDHRLNQALRSPQNAGKGLPEAGTINEPGKRLCKSIPFFYLSFPPYNFHRKPNFAATFRGFFPSFFSHGEAHQEEPIPHRTLPRHTAPNLSLLAPALPPGPAPAGWAAELG